MKIGVLGTGVVGRTVATRLAQLGHAVVMGARDATNPAAAEWAAASDGTAGTFTDAAAHGELVVNATSGLASLAALRQAGAGNLDGKVIVDIANPLDFSQGMPPTLNPVNTDSLGEQIQAAFPGARVVKTLNTVNANLMVDADRVPGGHHIFVAGNDAEAKDVVKGLLAEFGWTAERVIDLGGIGAARATEMYLPLWLALMGATGTFEFNIQVVKG